MSPETTSRFSSWRFIIAFIVTVLLVFGGYLSWRIYEFRRGEEWVRNVAENLERTKNEEYERAISDTYGGKTPEATLQMYIAAVEKGDYDLASKYFIEAKREEEKTSLNSLNDKNNIEKYIEILKLAQRTKEDENSVYLETELEGPNFVVNIIKYPNGIWKIEEI